MIKSVKLKSRDTILLLLLFILTIIVLVTNKIWTVRKRFILRWEPTNKNISCHYLSEGDALKTFTIKRNAKSIFFHETSCRGGLTSRQACAVESAAIAHPTWQIYLLFSSPVNQEVLYNTNLNVLLQYPNVNIARIYIEEYTRGLCFKPILSELNSSTFAINHSSDFLRITTLYLWGGVYLDLDLVVVRPLDELPNNWVAKQYSDEVALGAISLSKDEIGSKVSGAMVREICKNYNPNDSIFNGPELISRTLDKMCPSTIVPTGKDCQGLYIYGPELFYPVYYTLALQYFYPGDLDAVDNGLRPYIHHTWNGLTATVTVHKDSPYAKLAEQFCPQVYEMYGDEFGI